MVATRGLIDPSLSVAAPERSLRFYTAVFGVDTPMWKTRTYDAR
jgi:catechol 2,3-dioxygenase-like lactoylglutathione lyase family enzyme